MIEGCWPPRATPGTGSPIVAELAGRDGVVVSARGLAYAAALELALKIKEACYLHAMGLSCADLQHGPIAVVDAEHARDHHRSRLGPGPGRRRGPGPAGYRGRGAGLRDRRRRRPGRGVHAGHCPGPRLPEWLAPLGLIVPGQLLTEALARRLGLDPDNPRGLSKVTQTA